MGREFPKSSLELSACFRFRAGDAYGNEFYSVTSLSTPIGWTHVVMVILGMDHGEGLIGYQNGVEVLSASYRRSYHKDPRNGHLFIGKRGYSLDSHYASVEIDELAIWDQVLSPDEISALNDLYFPQ